jgi:hypothetical protein
VGRSILCKIDILLEATIQRESDRVTLVIALRKYRDTMALLTVHRELTEKEVDMFQDLVDDFFEKWLQIFGHEGVSNYIHLLSSVLLITLWKSMDVYIFIHSRVGKP